MHEYLYNDILISKFEHYFMDIDSDKGSLKIGDKGKAVENIWHALIILDFISGPKQSVYTQKLFDAVYSFQKANSGRADGEVGERTRKLLADQLLRHGTSIFRRFNSIRPNDKPVVFISYSHDDIAWAEILETALSNQDVNVIRDKSSFVPGSKITRDVHNSIASADRVVVIWSKNSASSVWVQEELMLARQLEQRAKISVLIFLNLDSQELFPIDSQKLAINACKTDFEKVIASIISALDEDKLWDL